jgi:hypothetical protein
MKRQRVVQTVRLLWSDRDACHYEANPTAALRVNNEREAIQIEQGVEGRVVLLHCDC